MSRAGLSRLTEDLRSLRVAVLHPDESASEAFVAVLKNIGCAVDACWPPRVEVIREAGVVFLAARPQTRSLDAVLFSDDGPPVIAIVDNDDAAATEAVLRFNIYGAIDASAGPGAVLTAMRAAINQARLARERARMIARLEQRLAGQRKIARAKAILMRTRNMTEDEAYTLIRSKAMNQRKTAEQIADAVIEADDLLSGETKRND